MRVVLRSTRRIIRSFVRRNMLCVKVEADLPVPLPGEPVGGETVVHVTGTRRVGTFRAVLSRISECVIGGDEDERDGENGDSDDAVSSQLAVRRNPTEYERSGPSRISRLWSVCVSAGRLAASVMTQVPTIIGFIGGVTSIINAYNRASGDDELVVVRRSQLKK